MSDASMKHTRLQSSLVFSIVLQPRTNRWLILKIWIHLKKKEPVNILQLFSYLLSDFSNALAKTEQEINYLSILWGKED